MNNTKTFESTIHNWQQPGVHIIVTQSAQTGAFWQHLRSKLSSSTLITAPNTLTECASWIGQLSQSFLGQQSVYWIAVPALGTKS